MDNLPFGNHARQHLITFPKRARHAFARQGGGVKNGFLLLQRTVERHAPAGFDFNLFAGLHFARRDSCPNAVAPYFRPFGANVQQLPDVPRGAVDRLVLQQLPECVEKHHRDGFRIFADAESTDGSYRHQGKLVEPVPLPRRFERLAHHR